MILRPVTTEWRRELAAARQRTATRSARLAAALPVCPLCGKPGAPRSYPEGKIFKHRHGLSCWAPAAPANNPSAHE